MQVIVYGSFAKQGNHHWMTYTALLEEYTLEAMTCMIWDTILRWYREPVRSNVKCTGSPRRSD